MSFSSSELNVDNVCIVSFQSDENRVAVALFPYSDPDTLPALIPPHLKEKPYHLPADMNR